MKHWGRWLILALPVWLGAFRCFTARFLLDAVGRGPLVLEGDVVRLTKGTSCLSRMETLEQRFLQCRNLRGCSVGPTFSTRLPVTISKSELKGRKRFTGPRVRHRKRGDRPGSFGHPRFPKALN
jgi:hypothetical protein